MKAAPRILVVDDSSTMRRMVMASLQRLPGVAFDQAESGLEALERLSLGAVDLVLLDLNMPDMHGLEVLRFMRAHETFSSIPVIVLTTRGDEGSRQAVMAAGASEYMTKPFRPDALTPTVQRLLAGA